MKGTDLIAEERKRQVEEEGFDAKHDFDHFSDELAIAGALYALPDGLRLWVREKANGDLKPLWWPFEKEAFKPTPNDRKRELVKAGALIAAEIDRITEQEEFEKWKEDNVGTSYGKNK